MNYKLAGFESPEQLHKAVMDLMVHRVQELYFRGDTPEIDEDPVPQREQFKRVLKEEYEQLARRVELDLTETLKTRYRSIRRSFREYLKGVLKDGIGEAKLYAWLVLEDHVRVLLEKATAKQDPTGLGTIRGYQYDNEYDGAGWNDQIHDRQYNLNAKED